MKIKCNICQIEFDRDHSKIAKNTTGKFFCSKPCLGVFMKSQKGKWNENHKTLSDKEHYDKTLKSRLETTEFCVHCNTTVNANIYSRFHGDNCNSQSFDLMVINLNDFDNYKDFIKFIKTSFIKYQLEKNENNISKISKSISIQRSHIYNIIKDIENEDKGIIINGVKPSELKNYSNYKVLIAKRKDFFKQDKIRKIREEFLEMTEDELYNSMLPQYLYYMNIQENEYDESDLIRLPLLIQHYKEIQAEDKVEDLEEALQEIKNKLKINLK